MSGVLALKDIPALLQAGRDTVQRTRQWYNRNEQSIQKAKKAASSIQKAFRASRNKYKGLESMGHPSGTATAKTDTGTQNTLLTSTRTLNFEQLINLTRGDNINARERDIIDLRGFKVCIQMQNLRLSTPMYVNVAIVSSKFDPTSSPSVTGFFRGQDATRGDDFSTSLQSLEFHCLPINTDKYFIQTHRRYKLAAFNTDQVDYAMKEFYVPIKRQIRFDNSASGSLNRQFYLVWWCDTLLAPGGAAAIPSAFNFQYKVVTYYREPKT